MVPVPAFTLEAIVKSPAAVADVRPMFADVVMLPPEFKVRLSPEINVMMP